ncbi:MAG TPA: polysaccharide deacetylase family protein, partial [Vicinamibacterales bacterium]|nr:polysaccharide deacetylase family protein [Vicinamibacterales bacterium]
MSAIAERAKAALRGAIPRSLLVRRLPGAAAANAVLLTFDDGPHPEVTPAVLDRLAAHRARAVFFIVGKRIRRAPHLLDRIQREGHVIGNHSLLHRAGYVRAENGRTPTFTEYYRDCVRCQAVLERRAGRRPTLFRPPGGRLTPTSVVVPKLIGLSCMTWSIEVQDWAFRSAEQAQAGARRLIDGIQPRDIVLLHDDNRFVVDLLDAALPALTAKGFDLASGIETVGSEQG